MSYWFVDVGNTAQMQGASIGYNRDLFRCHLTAVEALAGAGIPPPAEWTQVRDRYSAYIELGNPSADRLADAVISGRGDLVELRSSAAAEELTNGEVDSAINTKIQAAVLRELERLYQPVAQRNYKTAAESYSGAAKRFTSAARAIDVEAPGDTLVTATQAAREAWLAAPGLAAELDQSLLVLLAAAALCGQRPDVAYLTDATDVGTAGLQISLCTDPGKAHRRKTWVAWSTTGGRTGRWGPLVALGVTLRAASDPAEISAYEPPVAPVAVSRPGGRLSHWDPHDGPLPSGWKPVATGWLAEHTSPEQVP